MAGEPVAARVAAERGRDLADALGDRLFSRNNRAWLGLALMMQGDLAEAVDSPVPWCRRRRRPGTWS